jgi:flavin reductase (DIM6/NTAB) family NADH-FMN oxidoreductase RutF
LLNDVNGDASSRIRAFVDSKVDVPEEHFDRLASPVASLAVITTVDAEGRANAAPVATCFRNNHHPTCFEFTMDALKHTAANVLSTGEFVVNVVPFDRDILGRMLVTSLGFPRGVNELDVAGLTGIPSMSVRPPRVGECLSHFECKVEWTKLWLESRLTIVGRVVAASVNRGCIDEQGFVLFDKLRSAQHCGQIYGGKFLGGYDVLDVGMVWDGPDPKSYVPPGS